MITNNNFSVLPWYKSVDQQNHKKFYAYGNIYKLLAPLDKLLPFQIMRTKTGVSVSTAWSIIIYDQDDNAVTANIISSFIDAGLYVKTSEYFDCDVIVFPGTVPLNLGLASGIYYLKISDGTYTWYSDLITLTDVAKCVKIEWWDDVDFIMDNGAIAYDRSFKNTVYLDTDIGKPKYGYEEEGDTRDGLFFAEKQLSEKVYTFVFIAPEYLCDATRLIRLSDHVTVTNLIGSYSCDSFTAEVEWQEQGDLAVVFVEFKCGTIAKKIAPGFNDYNIDYNEAYTNE